MFRETKRVENNSLSLSFTPSLLTVQILSKIEKKTRIVDRIIISVRFSRRNLRSLEIFEWAGIRKRGRGRGSLANKYKHAGKMSQCGCDASRTRAHRCSPRARARARVYKSRERTRGERRVSRSLSLSLSLCARFARECVAIMQSGTLARIGQPRI